MCGCETDHPFQSVEIVEIWVKGPMSFDILRHFLINDSHFPRNSYLLAVTNCLNSVSGIIVIPSNFKAILL